MSLIKDFIKTLARGIIREDRPLMTVVVGLFILSLTMIIHGLSR
jgi:hypothetical protein